MVNHPAVPGEWSAFDLEIPATSPSGVAVPPMSGWLDSARHSRVRLDTTVVDLGGMPLGDLRRTARREILALALEYTRSLGLPGGPVGDGLVLGTGHQPVFVHPGIWVKYLALSRLIPDGGTGLNLIVDSDAAEDVAAEVPLDDGRLRRERVMLAAGGPDVPFEAITPVAAPGWRAFADAIDSRLATISDPAVREGWERTRGMIPPPEGLSLPGAIAHLRRALEGPRPYLDLPVSHLARTRAFRRFAFAILREARRFAEVHNTCLDAYREHYGVRTAAQPFPDLLIEPQRVEVPFWHVADRRRVPLFVDPERGRMIAGGQDLGSVPGGPDDEIFARLAIRPRALTLTTFARLLVTDLFIHGVGGGRYDRATDAVMRAFFDVAPPPYAATTATLFLPFTAGGSREAERRQLLRLLLDLQHNPDRFLDPDGGAHGALVEEKWELIRRLERAGELTRRERRSMTQRIRELNTILQVAVAERVADVQEHLQRLERHQEDAGVTAYRGYPFLLYRLEDVEALVDPLAAPPRPAEDHPSGP